MERKSREVWAQRVARWQESGLTCKEFASEMGINAASLANWKCRLASEARRRLGPKRKLKAQFVEVTPPPVVADGDDGPAATSARLVTAAALVEPLEVVLRDGLCVRVPVRFDAECLRQVVVALTER
jgi:transposase-like protein